MGFDYRRVEMLNQFGIKEEFSVLDYGDYISFSAVVGVDGGFNLTKPVIYTKEGFKSLATVIKNTGEPPEVQIKKYLQTRRGTYSLGYTMSNNSNSVEVRSITSLICVMKGRVSKQTGELLQNPMCELYTPCQFQNDCILARRVTSFPSKNGVFLLNAVKTRLLNNVKGSVQSREIFLRDRLGK